MSPSPRRQESPPVDSSDSDSPSDDSSSSPSPPTKSTPPPPQSKSPPPSSPPPKSSPPPDKSSSPPPSPDKSSPPPSPDKGSPPPSPDKSSPPPSPDKSSPPPNSDKSSPPPPNQNSPPSGDDSSSHSNNNNSPPNNSNNNSNGGSNSNNNNNNGNNNNGNNNNGNNNNGNNNSGNNNSGNNNNNNNDNNRQSPPRSGSSNFASPRLPPPSQALSASSLAIGSSNPSPSADGLTSGVQRMIIAGAGAGAGLIVIVMIICIVSCARRKKRRSHDQMTYYRDNSHGGGYYNNTIPQANLNINTSAGPNHMVQVPPRTSSAQVSSEYNWPIAPPPPPPMMSSSEMSSAGFSGPYNPAPPPNPVMALGFNQSSFTYNDLAVATNNFAQSNLLGQGGFGYVHKGVLPNGKEVAVKSLKASSGQGEREFQAEVDIISRVHHRHLVSLVGYCIAGSQRMLVYEFVPNGTLEYHLHGEGRPSMDWATRLKIALGAAKGFAYLHEDCHPRIIHRDIKTANILLELNNEAKVADFGLAKLSNENHTHVSTRIMGTFGYLAPEYASSGKLTEKSDVYSYGIMLLELITGRRPIDLKSDDDSLVDWAKPILIQAAEGGSYEELVDPRLEANYDPQEMLRMVASAGACVRQSAKKRPKMSQIVRALEGDISLDVLNEGVKSMHTAMFGSGSSEDGGSDVDMKRFRKGEGSQEYSSSELGTGEFVHNNKH